MLWLLLISFSLLIIGERKNEESKISCFGISVTWRTHQGYGKCDIRWPINPLHPITCMLENVCIIQYGTPITDNFKKNRRNFEKKVILDKTVYFYKQAGNYRNISL
jgi:hypothetical protein